ncbi:methylenetetrahydrofolate dehydrogenase (NADP+)/methenyltetrahydrofolate cyclohydrolase [Amycolatopsis bartoniae]|uniref:Bifunctional protein FolD n=1 Tax=Amycolatopsis bartoniae TaxID=941986 RepID=A0A8H9MFH2_9PSEU|nr:bifunctional 5,10-methylenetetrahydrofolate dehydrogenase/5,10-methenyltetrahydrofolate cyclohydrolase [Amycolatopsis bartoniae]MBB2937584.1 methylenetetrahydrofolate dehydrogenase (NADP+)/methenyltetrahydrofolate cyclohydrolase [Amycolatopsis bartoniae]TVT05906.1 bifunctional 5,10-methylenetetrahydrofolate dehydrogenase/5,10-methenyltetrahydrofolate cyclohydrolase [Amycolatopsis bartoniae]GHF82362.1 bifunctional protein FolD [Amycolatopsis bartoniae]
MPRLMNGAELAGEIVERAAKRAASFLEKTGRKPCLATVLVGDDPASVTYVRMKQRRCAGAGVESRHVQLPAATTTAEAVAQVRELSEDPAVDGILVQHPVPAHVDERAVFEAIAPGKDVDGVTMHSFAAMALGEPGFLSCTPGGILRLLDAHGVEIEGKHAVVIGRSPILGKPAALLLLARNATVTVCHSRTADLKAVVRTADIVVAAVGKPEFVRGEWLKPGAAVVDAGYNPGNVGDVDFKSAEPVAGWLTPVPGGVGPTTIAVLLEQTVEAAWEGNSTPR